MGSLAKLTPLLTLATERDGCKPSLSQRTTLVYSFLLFFIGIVHEQNFRAAVKSINTAVQRALKKSKYTSAAVLPLSWRLRILNLGPIT